MNKMKCPKCKGKGTYINKGEYIARHCRNCFGTGVIKESNDE